MLLKPTELQRSLAAILLVLLGSLAFAQDDSGSRSQSGMEADAEPVAEDAAAEADASDETDDPLLDDPELDQQGFDPTADDDFVPSEDIPADAPIAFPTDI